ncbi:MAG: hypothetical protein KJO35_10430, partial [Gammaproteobacteria bacterium]|nr:hypothetical protein [Gammaproteobacteria bacterium]
MKRRLALALGLFVCAGAANADLESMATAHVFVDVVSNIAVRANQPQVDMGDIQTGVFSTSIEFRVDANHEDIDLACFASDLYKGDDPTNDDVAPIPLFLPAGCLIDPINANPTGGGSSVAAFD